MFRCVLISLTFDVVGQCGNSCKIVFKWKFVVCFLTFHWSIGCCHIKSVSCSSWCDVEFNNRNLFSLLLHVAGLIKLYCFYKLLLKHSSKLLSVCDQATYVLLPEFAFNRHGTFWHLLLYLYYRRFPRTCRVMNPSSLLSPNMLL